MGFLMDLGFMHYPLEVDSKQFESIVQDWNEWNALIYYAYIALIFLLFSVSKLTRHVYIRNRHFRKEVRLLARPSRIFRRWLIRKAIWPWTTRGHMLIILGYLIINIVVCSLHFSDDLRNIQLARRTGWMSVINFSLLIFFSMKNTPLSYLTGYSYERLNVFHRWIAVTAWVQGVAHTIAIALGTATLVPNQLRLLIEWENIMGIVALFFWTLMMLSFPILRNIAYEWFYLIHAVSFPIIVVTLFLHNFHCREPVLVAIGLYALDRIVRTNRYIWHNRSARKLKATLTATKDGATLVSVPRGALEWRAGSHAFLNIPRLSYFQSHPFTIASVGDDEDRIGEKKNVEFLVRPKKGFTKKLYQEAKRADLGLPRRRTKEVTAYVDGPYGGVPNFSQYDRVILIAAGSGVTFILPIALSIIRRGRVKSVDFIWSVRDKSGLDAVKKQLHEIAARARLEEVDTFVNMRLHITGKTPPQRQMSTIRRMISKAKRQPIPSYQYDLYGSSYSLGLEGANSRPESINMVPLRHHHRSRSRTLSTGKATWPANIDRRESNDSDTTLLPLIGSPGVPGRSLSPRHFRVGSDSQRPQHVRTSSGYIGYNPYPHKIMGTPERVASPDFDDSLQSTPRMHASPSMMPTISSPGFTLRNSVEIEVAGGPKFDAVDSERAISADDEERQMALGGRNSRDPLETYYVAGRPDIPRAISTVVDSALDLDTIAVGACGVTAMTDEVRAVVAKCIEARGPSMSVFCEEFGW